MAASLGSLLKRGSSGQPHYGSLNRAASSRQTRTIMDYRVVLSFLKASGVSQDRWEDYGDEVFEPLGALVVRSPATPEPGPNPTRPGPTRPEEARPGPSPARPRANPSPNPTRPDPKFDPDQPDRSLARPEPGPTPTRPAPTPGPSDPAEARVDPKPRPTSQRSVLKADSLKGHLTHPPIAH